MDSYSTEQVLPSDIIFADEFYFDTDVYAALMNDVTHYAFYSKVAESRQNAQVI